GGGVFVGTTVGLGVATNVGDAAEVAVAGGATVAAGVAVPATVAGAAGCGVPATTSVASQVPSGSPMPAASTFTPMVIGIAERIRVADVTRMAVPRIVQNSPFIAWMAPAI